MNLVLLLEVEKVAKVVPTHLALSRPILLAPLFETENLRLQPRRGAVMRKELNGMSITHNRSLQYLAWSGRLRCRHLVLDRCPQCVRIKISSLGAKLGHQRRRQIRRCWVLSRPTGLLSQELLFQKLSKEPPRWPAQPGLECLDPKRHQLDRLDRLFHLQNLDCTLRMQGLDLQL